jgi:hypothetical protein
MVLASREPLETITPTASNGIIKRHSDLRGDCGNRCTNLTRRSGFHIALPGVGRSQTWETV